MNENFLKEEIDALKLDGLTSVKNLKISCDAVPRQTGVYVVLGNYAEMPDFLEKGTGPEFHIKKGELPRAMNYPVADLEGKWVDDTWIMYIGKSDDGLYKRISTYIKFAKGKDAAHRGGRAVWQLPDSDNLLIGWKVVDASQSARTVEKEWLAEFKKRHGGKLPFANRQE